MTMPPAELAAGGKLSAAGFNAQARGVAAVACSSLTNSTAEAVIASVSIPAGDVGLVANGGYVLWLFAQASCTGTPTLTIRVRIGSLTGTLLFNSNAITLASGITAARLVLDFEMMISAAGASGAFDCMVTLRNNLAAAGTTVATMSGTPAATINTTAAVTLVVTAQWSAASASNTVTSDVGVLNRI